MKLIALFSLSFLCACQAQTDTPVTDCSELGFQAGPPFTGGDHALCGDLGGNQCCSPDYLTMTVEAGSRMAFKEALKEELEESDLEYGTVNDNLMAYLDSGFISRLIQNFPFADQLDSASTTQLMSSLQTLASNLLIPVSAQDNFNPEEFVSSITSQLGELAAARLSGGDSEQQTCVRNVIMGAVNADATAQLVNAVRTIRQSASSLSRIHSFVSSYRQTLIDRFTPIRGCVERLARRSFCSRCSRRIPPLCRGTCNDLIRGCLSPVYSAYNRDFTQLRNVSQAIISNMENTIRGFYLEQRQIIPNPLNIYQQLVTTCGITSIPTSGPFTTPNLPVTPTLPPIGKRETDDDEEEDEEERRTFSDAREMLGLYEGIFDYDEDGPEFCEPSSREEDFCETMAEPSGGRACRMNETCTSTCHCWDGDQMVEMRPTRNPLSRPSGVREQGGNPEVEGLEDQLAVQAAELGTETPANAFLTSDEFMAVAPEGVEVPPAEPYSGSGAVRGVVSLVAMAIAAVVGLLL